MIKKPSPDRMLHISMETVKGEGLSMEKVGIAQQKTHGNLRVPPPTANSSRNQGIIDHHESPGEA